MTENTAPVDGLLFDMDAPPPVRLSDRFGVAPFSVWDKSAAEWQARKRRWLSLGIQSELGRSSGLTYKTGNDFMAQKVRAAGGATSVFDPVLCELAYRWWSNPGDNVLDPFSGGSVRGITAGVLGRWYTGVDLREDQVLANDEQADLVGPDGLRPMWLVGDATRTKEVLARAAGVDPSSMGADFDFILSCPPYGSLERYSDDPADLSNMSWPAFRRAHRDSIFQAADLLHTERFAVWVISDVRDKQSGGVYRRLVADTCEAFHSAGLELYNDIILREPVGTGRLRGASLFNATRKVVRMHQHVLVFVKGDPWKAAKRLDPIDPKLIAQELEEVDVTDEFEQDTEPLS